MFSKTKNIDEEILNIEKDKAHVSVSHIQTRHGYNFLLYFPREFIMSSVVHLKILNNSQRKHKINWLLSSILKIGYTIVLIYINVSFHFLSWNFVKLQNVREIWTFRCKRILRKIRYERPNCMGFTTACLLLEETCK